MRAWNRSVTPQVSLPFEAAVDIPAAHLFGLFRGAHLRENATVIAFSVQMRAVSREGKLNSKIKADAQRVADLADQELLDRGGRRSPREEVTDSTVLQLDTDSGPLRIELAEPLISFTRRLRQSGTVESAAAALREMDSRLDVWQKSRERDSAARDIAVLPFGVEVHFPHGFDPRDERG